MGSHNLPPSRSDISILTPASTGTQFSNPGGMQSCVDLVGLVIYQGSIPTQRQSPIPVLTRLNEE